MSYYQIKFPTGEGCASFAYFEAKKGIHQKACEVANKWASDRIESSRFRMFSSFKPPRTAHVREYNKEKHSVVRGGHKFKLRLSFFEATYINGRKERTEWYEADED